MVIDDQFALPQPLDAFCGAALDIQQRAMRSTESTARARDERLRFSSWRVSYPEVERNQRNGCRIEAGGSLELGTEEVW